jgi:hypothetical protein
MRLSRVPVLSLCRRDLVCDPGGHRSDSPSRQAVAAFQPNETVRGLLWQGSGTLAAAYPRRDHNLRTTFEAQYRPRRLASPGF